MPEIIKTCCCRECGCCLGADPFCSCNERCICVEPNYASPTEKDTMNQPLTFPRKTALTVPVEGSTRYGDRTWSFLWEEATKVSIVTITTSVRIMDASKVHWEFLHTISGPDPRNRSAERWFVASRSYEEVEPVSEEEGLARIASGEWTQRVWTTFDRIGAYVQKGKLRLYGKKNKKFYSPKMLSICKGEDTNFGALEKPVRLLAERTGLTGLSMSLAARMTRQIYPQLAELVQDGVDNPLELSTHLDWSLITPNGSLKNVWEAVGIRGRAMQAYAMTGLKSDEPILSLSLARLACTSGLEVKDIPEIPAHRIPVRRTPGSVYVRRIHCPTWDDYSWIKTMTLDARRKILQKPAHDLSRLGRQVLDAGYQLPRTCIDAEYLHDQLAAVINTMGDVHQPMPTFASWERMHGQKVGGYTASLPRCAHELKDWGRELSHCIGGYYSTMANGESLLLGLHKGDVLEYCAEVVNGKVEQLRGSHNSGASESLNKALQQKLIELHITKPGTRTSDGFCSEKDTNRKINVELIYAEAELKRTMRLKFDAAQAEIRLLGVDSNAIMRSVANTGRYQGAITRDEGLFQQDGERIITLLEAMCPLLKVEVRLRTVQDGPEFHSKAGLDLKVTGDRDAIRAAAGRAGVYIPDNRVVFQGDVDGDVDNPFND